MTEQYPVDGPDEHVIYGQLQDLEADGSNKAVNDNNQESLPRLDIDNAEFILELTSPEGMESYRRELEAELAAEPAYMHLDQIERDWRPQKEQLTDEAGVIVSDKEDEFYAASDKHERRRQFAAELWGEEKTRRFDELRKELDGLDDGRVEVMGDDGRDLLETMVAGSAEEPIHGAHQFIRLKVLDDARRSSDPARKIAIEFGRESGTVDIPTSFFVSAEGFDTKKSFGAWYGRYGGREEGGGSKDGKTSLEVIKEYAAIPNAREETQVLSDVSDEKLQEATVPPPVESMNGYILPDGRIYFKSGNAHRVAAAIRRGDKSIQFQGEATVYYLDHIPPGLEA